jgi:predicted TIM-barrel fold metal-dependent hydrolase
MAEYTDFQTFTEYDVFDCDQHLYEPGDCYTSFIESKYASRTLRGAQVEGRWVILLGDREVPSDFSFDECYRPGSLKEMLKSIKGGEGGEDLYHWMKLDRAFVDPDLRREQLARQNVGGAIMFSGALGLFADPLIDDAELYWASSWAYLRWMESTWGFDTGGVVTTPVISMRDRDKACEQLDWLFERGARAVSLIPGPAYGRSPGDPYFDRLWGRIADAGALVCYHINEAVPGYKASRSKWWGQQEQPTHYTQSAWQWLWAYGETPALETFSALIYDNLFGRFPDLKILSGEHGAEWVPMFLRRMDKMRGMGRNGHWIDGQLPERPSEIFKRAFRVVPYWEDDIVPIVEQCGRDVIVGGSDFPHAEGLAFPSQLVDHLDGLSAEDQRWIMRDNARSLVGRG